MHTEAEAVKKQLAEAQEAAVGPEPEPVSEYAHRKM